MSTPEPAYRDVNLTTLAEVKDLSRGAVDFNFDEYVNRHIRAGWLLLRVYIAGGVDHGQSAHYVLGWPRELGVAQHPDHITYEEYLASRPESSRQMDDLFGSRKS